jgi:excisionase family DNA binding protein
MKKEQNELDQTTLLSIKQILTTKEVSMLTGLSVSTLHKLTSTRKIPHYKSRGGKANYYNKEEVINWMLGCRVKTTDELEEEALAFVTTKR